MKTVFCFDLDGTVTRQEILPALASEIALTEEMSLLTSLTMKGVIPFESSFRLRCRLLRDVPVSRVREIVADIALSPAIVSFIQNNRDRCAIVTGNLDVWIAGLVERLGCRYFSSIGIARDDRLQALQQILRKNQAVKKLRGEGFHRVVAIGDGFNDVPMFEASDVTVAFGGVHEPVPEIVQRANYVVYGEKSLCRLLNGW
jgi:HAD superfamily phosphoserine phosphatase-like hydrolase